MKRKLNTREKVLLVGLGIAAVVMFRGWRDDGLDLAIERVGKEEASRRLGQAPVVRMDMLAYAVEDFESPGRDLFDYYTPPRKPVKPPVVVERVKVDRGPRPQPPKPPPVIKSLPGPPKPSFAYLGFLGSKDERIAVFDGGKSKQLVLARIGDVVDDKFTLVEFKYEKVVIGYTDDRFKGKTSELEMSAR